MSEISCIFCKIVAGEIPAQKVMETPEFVVIRDIHPQARVHLLVFPKNHVATLADALPAAGADAETHAWTGRMMAAGVAAARQEGLLPGGFRSVINTGVGGGQTVFHLHMHVLGGEPLSGRFG